MLICNWCDFPSRFLGSNFTLHALVPGLCSQFYLSEPLVMCHKHRFINANCYFRNHFYVGFGLLKWDHIGSKRHFSILKRECLLAKF